MTENPPTPAPKTRHVLEQGTRLSESFLWSRQRRFYEGQGVSAWSSKTIPNHVTTNPVIARTYARLLVAWLRDLQSASGGTGGGILDGTQPVYVVELGSGPGRFGFYFLRQLSKLLAMTDAPRVRVTYVMTDVVERNLAFVRNHPELQPYVEAGMLDFARFDAENPGELTLLHSGIVLGPGTVRNPLVCVANYVFDSIRQDLFSVERGEFRENLVNISSPRPESDPDEPGLLERLTIDFEPHPVNVEYYDDPEYNAILKEYQQELPNVGFLFPLATLSCIRYLSRLSGGRMLLLSSDKGFDRVDALMGQGGPGFAIHGGCFSLMVNYEAVGRYVRNHGGQFLRVSHRNTYLNTITCVLGMREEETPRLREAFDENVSEFGPDHYFAVAVAVRTGLKEMAVDDILSWVRYTNWDPIMMFQVTPTLMDKAAGATMNQKADLADAIRRVWEEYYYIGEEPNGAMVLGVLFRFMQYHRDALTFFQRSLQLTGPRAQTYYEMGVCFYELRDMDTALEYADRALDVDPTCGEARSLRLRIEADRARSAGEPSIAAPSSIPAPPPAPEPERAPVQEPVPQPIT